MPHIISLRRNLFQVLLYTGNSTQRKRKNLMGFWQFLFQSQPFNLMFSWKKYLMWVLGVFFLLLSLWKLIAEFIPVIGFHDWSLGFCNYLMSAPFSVSCFTVISLKGLGYDGIGRLLRMARTAGTVLDTLPPSRSVLASSAAKSYQPDVSNHFFLIFLPFWSVISKVGQLMHGQESKVRWNALTF